jgi:hypothetical protein
MNEVISLRIKIISVKNTINKSKLFFRIKIKVNPNLLLILKNDLKMLENHAQNP